MIASGMQARDSLMHFLSTRQCIIKKGDVRKVTHTRMDGGGGGKFHVPPEALSEFYAAYGMELHNERPLFYIEVNTPVFVLHFDIDFASMMDEERTASFCATLYAAVNEYFHRPKKAVVCAILDAEANRKGPGLHIVFPKAHVSNGMACAIWAGVVARCEEKLPWGADAWSKTVDVAVLAERGSLRMVGSDKCETCATCRNGPDRKCCADCGQCGRVACGKVYWPWRMIPDDAETRQELADMRSNRAHAVRVCSIQSSRDKPSEDFSVPPGAPLASRYVDDRKQGRSRPVRTCDDAMPCPVKNAEQLALRHEILEALTQSIKDYDPSYGQLVIRDVQRCSGKNPRCFIRVRGFNDRFCLNKGSEHKSNQIYFVISTKGLSQRCYSKKPEPRAGGCCCKSFEGPVKAVPDAIMVALLDVPEAQPEAPLPARSPNKRQKRNGESLVCYGGYYHISPDAMY
jgi:Herpesviridae UL52/UL70 DNA primase/Prim-pol 4